jgi:predicted adenine nucleotide alpha hydrolase (AANH) superfamily ATPase
LGISFDTVVEKYNPKEYNDAVKGQENLGEGSARCLSCYRLRLNKTAEYASKNGFDYFATTLSVSPYKNIKWIREISKKLEQVFRVKYLDKDFKKCDGYKRSIELSKEIGL